METQLLKLKFALRMGIDADPRAEPKLDCKEDDLLKFSGTLVISLKKNRICLLCTYVFLVHLVEALKPANLRVVEVFRHFSQARAETT